MEKRDRTRKKVRITIQAEPGAIRGYTSDISRGGLFIVTTKLLQPGTRIRLKVATESGPALGIGTVKWAKRVPPQLIRDMRGGMGVEFTWLSPELKALVESMFGEKPV